MSANSNIEWTEATWNPIAGCTHVSPGCDHCYAERMAARFHDNMRYWGVTRDGKWTGTVNTFDGLLDVPLHWRKPRRVFVCSMADPFHESVPDSFLDSMFAIMALCPQHTFQILTKRPGRMLEYLLSSRRFRGTQERFHYCIQQSDRGELVLEAIAELYRKRIVMAQPCDTSEILGKQGWPLPNVWLGVTVEDQDHVWRIGELLACPAAVYFVSVEPMLGPVVLRSHLPRLDWVICGGESGPGARPMDLGWVELLQEQCKAAGVPFFMKQITSKGRKVPYEQWPSDMKVREWPHVG